VTSEYGKRRGIGGYFKNLQVGDYRLIIAIIALWTFGLVMVYSATSATDGTSLFLKQAIIGGVGIAGMLVISFLDYHVLAVLALVAYPFAIGGLFLVRAPGIGKTVNGASRWIEIAGVQFQPSELLKPIVIMGTAFIIALYGKKLRYRVPRFLAISLSLLAAAFIYYVTENLSTAIIVLAIGYIMVMTALPRSRALLWLFLTAVAGGAIVYWYYTSNVREVQEIINSGGQVDVGSFRSGRILAWLFPDVFTDLSMQSRYSLYAIGFGGILGRGLGHGTMKYYIPEAQNDFIFAVIAEELGLVGCITVIFLFGYTVWRIMVLAQHAKDMLGCYIAYGIGIHVAVQTLLNIGVATSVLPNTGVSLPFISYGGTALLFQMVEMGVLLNVSKHIPGSRSMSEAPQMSGTKSRASGKRRVA